MGILKRKKQKNSENILEVDWVNGNIFLLKKEILKTVGNFDENFSSSTMREIFKGILNLIKFN